MSRCRFVFLLIVLAHLSTGCALMPSGSFSELPSTAIPTARIDNVPFFPQAKYQCGPAALAMALQWSGVDVRPDDLVPLVYTPGRKGSLQPGLITGTRRHNRLAYPIHGLDCLIKEVAAGHPVIVLQNLGLDWIPKWHYALVVGYDMDSKSVLLHTGTRAFRQVGLSTFMRTWQRGNVWGLLVLPVGRLPACAEEPAYLRAVLGLQQAGHLDAAVRAYDAAFGKWSGSPQWPMAKGNVLYAQGLLSDAMDAFSVALNIDASNGDALNNLAHVLAELGELERAEHMARRAVDTGGAHVHLYRRTLAEIMARQAAGNP